MEETTTPRSFWGRSGFGGGTATLLGVSAALAVVTSGALAWAAHLALDGDRRLVALVLAGALAPGFFAIAWALLVDRSTLRDVVERPELSVEHQWLQRAQSGAFSDLLLAGGVLLVLGAFLDVDLGWHVALASLLGLVMTDAVARYLWLKRREG